MRTKKNTPLDDTSCPITPWSTLGKSIAAIIFYLMPGFVDATTQSPSHCKPILLHGEFIQFSGAKDQVILLHNTSKNKLWLTHAAPNMPSSSNWSRVLDAGRWSALIGSKGGQLGCVESTPGHEQQTPCQSIVEACSIKKHNQPQSTQQMTWVADNIPLHALILTLKQNRHTVPSSAQTMVN